MEVRYSIKGDLEVQRQLQAAGSRVRNAVTAALFELIREAQDIAIANVPVGRRDWNWGASKRYGRGAIKRGIVTYMQGEGVPQDRMVRLSNAQKEAVAGYEKDSSTVVAALFSGFYTGRFYETGFSGMVNVRGKASAYGRTFTKAYTAMRKSYAKKHGAGPLDFAKHTEFYEKASRAAGKASDGARKAYERKHTVRAHPFMKPAADATLPHVGSVVQAAIARALNGR